jgi:hypothetical protein
MIRSSERIMRSDGRGKADSGLQAYGAWSVNIGTLGQIRIGAYN